MKTLASAVALLAGMAFAGPANAEAIAQKMSFACRSLMVFCVYDQGGNLLGMSQDAGLLKREISGKLYRAGYNANGLVTDLALFYALPNCSGAPLIQSGYIAADGATVVADAPPLWAQFDGKSFWSASGPAELTAPTCNICYGVVCNGNPEGVPMPYAANIGPYWPTYAPAAVIETPKLVEPASSCAAAQNCITVK